MKKETEKFLDILAEVSGQERLNPTDTIGDVFERGLEPIEFELALYSLEATTQHEIAEAFYEGSIDKDLEKTIDGFLSEYLGAKPVADPLYVTRVLTKFYQSVKWEYEEQDESGEN